MTPRPGLYVGTLRHRRFTPTPHAFRYSLFMALLDIDALSEAMTVSPLTSYNRANWAAFDDRDHLGDPARPLRERVAASARAAGRELPDGRILLLTHLRYAGYAFNPISLFYCYDRAGALRQVLAEVNNTFGGQQLYWLDHDRAPGAPLRQQASKALYVSPFMAPDVAYDFVLTVPGDRLVAHMNVVRAGATPVAGASRLFDATLSLAFRPWTRRELHRALVRFPFMTAKVIAAIHWQALRLYLKGVPVVPETAAAPKRLAAKDVSRCS